MATRTVLRSRSRARQTPTWFNRYQIILVRLVTVVAYLTLALFAVWGIRQWYLQANQEVVARYLAPAKERFSAQFNACWFSVLPVPAFSEGDEPSVRAFLEAEPAVEALVSRGDGTLWLRSGNRLERSPKAPLTNFYLDLAARLVKVGSEFLSPEEGKDPDFGWCLRTAIAADGYTVIKRVTPGSTELEGELRHFLGLKPDVRVNLHHMQPDLKQGQTPATYLETPFQIPEGRLNSEPWMASYWNRAQTVGWVWSLIPGPELRVTMQLFLLRQMAVLLVPVLILGILLLVIYRMRRGINKQAELAKDRLASVTHGLKTPLAVIKAWCDASRHGQLGKDQVDLTLIRIGEQVDHLTMIIENGLRTLHPQALSVLGEPVTLTWLQEIEAEFGAICAESGRTFKTRFQGEGGCANRISLQQVLQAFLENALIHGQGTISFSSLRKGNRLLLMVEDEGPGLKGHQLKQLGLPFLRFRREEAEGFESEGVGIGLSLAIQIADKEGWGLGFRSEAGSGLTVTLELRD